MRPRRSPSGRLRPPRTRPTGAGALRASGRSSSGTSSATSHRDSQLLPARAELPQVVAAIANAGDPLFEPGVEAFCGARGAMVVVEELVVAAVAALQEIG